MLLPLWRQCIPLQGCRRSDALCVGFKQEAGVQGGLRGGVDLSLEIDTECAAEVLHLAFLYLRYPVSAVRELT